MDAVLVNNVVNNGMAKRMKYAICSANGCITEVMGSVTIEEWWWEW